MKYIEYQEIKNNGSVKHKKVPFNKNFTQVYKHFYYLISEVRGCSRSLMDFILMEMDKNNCFTNSPVSQVKFLDYTKNHYKLSTLPNAFKELTQKKLLLRLSKGIYQVNPQCFWQKGEQELIEELQIVMTFNDSEVFEGQNYSLHTVKTLMKK